VSDPVRILVVRLGAMGDVFHAMPAVASLKASFPGAALTWAIDPKWAPLLDGCPWVDEIIPFDRRNAGSVGRALADLRRECFDIAVDFQGLLKSSLLLRAARAEVRFGFERDQLREPAAGILYDRRSPALSAHVVDKNLDLAQTAGATVRRAEFFVPVGASEGALPDDPFVLANPLAGWPAKQWPLDNYAALARRLKEDRGWSLVLNGPPSAAPQLEAVTGVHVHLSGLPGLIDATRRAVAVVGLDSGPLHLAAALGKPGAALFGPTDPRRNGPYGGSFTVLRALDAVTSYKRRLDIDPSMREIRPEAVAQALLERLL
jgi:heptosyltransferase I